MLEGCRFPLRVEAADGDASAIGIAQAFQNLNGSCFSGAVGPEQAKDLAFFDAEADTAHGFDVAVPLDEVLHLKDGIGHDRCPQPPKGAVERGIAYRSWTPGS